MTLTELQVWEINLEQEKSKLVATQEQARVIEHSISGIEQTIKSIDATITRIKEREDGT